MGRLVRTQDVSVGDGGYVSGGVGFFDFPDDCATVLDEQATGNVFRRFSAAMKLRSLACWNKISTALGASTPANGAVVPQGQVAE